MLDSSPSEDEFKGKGEPVKVTWISRWGAYTQTYNILGLEKAEGFRAAL